MDFPDFADQDEAVISFHTVEIDFTLSDSGQISDWIENTILAEKKELATLNFIFCNDTYLHKINVDFLDHDTLTDVISFPYTELPAPIIGDIYISIDRIQENADKFNVSFLQELKRVMIHGVLHLCGYGDKTDVEQQIMRDKEDFYLERY